MKSIIAFSSVFVILLFSSCASLISKSNYRLPIGVNPPGSKVVVKSHSKKRGDSVVFKGNAPCVVVLPSAEKYFKKATYTIELSAEGRIPKTVPITTEIDDWYWGNILVGGLIGWIIVDPLTGSMYKITEKRILENLQKESND